MAALCYNTRINSSSFAFLMHLIKNGYHAAILDTDVAGPFIPKCLESISVCHKHQHNDGCGE